MVRIRIERSSGMEKCVCLLITHNRDLVCVTDQNCADKPVFTPSTLVVKFGDPTSASCAVCQNDCINNLFGLESPVGNSTNNGTTISWKIDSLIEWLTSPLCYYSNATDYQCCTVLPVTLYRKLIFHLIICK